MMRIIARNSAPMSTNRPEALTNARMRNSTECTGLRAKMTASPEATKTVAKIQKKKACATIVAYPQKPVCRAPTGRARRSLIRRIHRDVARQLALPARAVLQQPVFVVEQFLAGLGRELEIRPLDNGVHWAGFLAKAAIDALRHIDVVAGCAPGAVVAPRARFDGDGLRRADRLAQLAGDAALLAVGITPQRMFASEAWRQRRLLVRIIQRQLRHEHITYANSESG